MIVILVVIHYILYTICYIYRGLKRIKVYLKGRVYLERYILERVDGSYRSLTKIHLKNEEFSQFYICKSWNLSTDRFESLLDH